VAATHVALPYSFTAAPCSNYTAHNVPQNNAASVAISHAGAWQFRNGPTLAGYSDNGSTQKWSINTATGDATFNHITGQVSGQPYIVSGMFNGTLTANLVVVRHPAPIAFTIAQNCASSQAVLATAATASTTLSLQKNGTQFGTATFAAGSTTATFACASATTFAAGDVLTVIAPASPDSTAGNLGLTLFATR
jgi:hypothetical protein